MADIHNALKRGPWGSALSRLLGMTQGDNPLERVGETLTPTVDMWDDPTWAYLRREFLLTYPVVVGAVAGEYSGAALVNPAGSGVLAVIERIAVWTAAVNTVRLYIPLNAGVVTGTYALSGKGWARDSRLRALATINPGMVEIWSGSDAGGLGSSVDEMTCPAAGQFGQFSVSLPLVLTPGHAYVVAHGTVNTAVSVIFGYRERKAQVGELE